MDDVPEEAYGRVTNPERFQPLLTAADELIADLQRRFEVTVTRSRPAPTAPSKRTTLDEVVKIVPVRADQAPLTVTRTSFPGVYLDMGAWEHVALPACGCDACDEDAPSLIDALNQYAQATTAGQLTETITDEHPPLLLSTVWRGAEWRRSSATTLTAARVAELRTTPVQPPDDGRWVPWSLRSR